MELNTADKAEDEAKEASLLIVVINLFNSIVKAKLIFYTVKGLNKRFRRRISVKLASP